MAQYGKLTSSRGTIGSMQSPLDIAGAPTIGSIPATGGSSVSKSITYDGTKSDRIFAISSDIDDASVTEELPNIVEVTNTGSAPIMLMVGYSSYSNDTTIVATDYLHVLLPPKETFFPPVRAVISDNADKTIMFGTAIKNTAPNSNMYTDSGADVDHATASTIGSDATHTTLNLEDGHSNYFRVNDLIRIENEICEVTAVGTGADLANSTLTIIRGVHGSTAATHADDVAVRLPFFNAYHDFDKYSVAQTDFDGKFMCYNMFGQGRAATGVQGIIAGSFALKFYDAGYQELGLSGITGSTNSGLTASTTYAINIAVDGGSVFADLSFQTDSSNLNFGDIIDKIQAALDAQFYTSGNLFEKKVRVKLLNGDICFTSGQRLSTSAISLASPTGAGGETNFFGNGRIPAIGSINTAVAARLPDDVIYDRVTYGTTTNPVFCWDDGYGNITGVCQGTINYETGTIDITGAPANAEFVFTCLHTSAFAGALNQATTSRINSLVDIYANTPSQVKDASVAVRVE